MAAPRISGVRIAQPTRTFHCRYRNMTQEVKVAVMDSETMFEELVSLTAQAHGINPALLVPGECKLLLAGGISITPKPVAAAPRRVRHILDVEDGATLLFCPAFRAPAVVSVTPNGDPEDLEHMLRCCSANVTSLPIHQPRFEFTYFYEEDGEDAPVVPVCGPCAHTCHGMRHIHIMDPVKVLNRPFVCGCASIRVADHECFWKNDPVRGRIEGSLAQRTIAAWNDERVAFVSSLAPQIEREAAITTRKKIEKLTERLRSSMDLFEQYFDKDAQNEATGVVPLTALNARAEAATSAETSGSPTSIHDALLAELVYWFYNDFFSWVTTPDCELCGCSSVAHREQRQAIPTPEERLNWAFHVELYECPQCGVEVRFPRYQKARRLLTYRKGRCGEFASCFTLIATALGYECRLITSLADQAWLEVYSTCKRRWVHVDPSHGVLDDPTMYERKAQTQPVQKRKVHNYVFSYNIYEVVDVTRRYNTAPQLLQRDLVPEVDLSRLLHGMTFAGYARLDRVPFFESRTTEEQRELSRIDESAPSDSGPFRSVESIDDWDGDINLILHRRGDEAPRCTVDADDSRIFTDGALCFPDGPVHVAVLKNVYGLGARLPVPARAASSITDVTTLEISFTGAREGSSHDSWVDLSISDALAVRLELATATLTVLSAYPLPRSKCNAVVGGNAPIVTARSPDAFCSVMALGRQAHSATVSLVLDSTGTVSATVQFARCDCDDGRKEELQRCVLRRGFRVPPHAWSQWPRGDVRIAGAAASIDDLRLAWA